VRLSEQVGVVGRGDLGVGAEPALERVVAEAAVQDVIGGLADAVSRDASSRGAQKKPIESRVPPGAHGRTRWGVATR
jgi:hypothetical protein